MNPKTHKINLSFFLVLCVFNIKGQAAYCVHGGGVSYLLDAYLGSIGACNCEKASVFLFNFSTCNTQPYVLTFEDNFSGQRLDTSIWEVQPWGQGTLSDAATQEYNSMDNVTVKNGTCFITAKKETVERRAVNWKSDDEVLSDGIENLRTYYYTSSNLWTKKKFFHGKYEIRCKMPAGKGFWPAFWMFGGERWNEIDVFDNYDGTHKLVTSIGHDYEGNSKSNGCNKTFSGFDFNQWHTFTCIFDFDRISFLVDNEEVRIINRYLTVDGNPLLCGDNIESGTYYKLKSYPIEPMSVIVNLALIRDKGEKGGFVPVDDSTPFPSSLEIDYIRFWERKADNFIIYPNPVSLKVSVQSDHTTITNLNIYDFCGQKVQETKYSNFRIDIDLSVLPSGLYFLEIVYDGGREVKKVLKL